MNRFGTAFSEDSLVTFRFQSQIPEKTIRILTFCCIFLLTPTLLFGQTKSFQVGVVNTPALSGTNQVSARGTSSGTPITSTISTEVNVVQGGTGTIPPMPFSVSQQPTSVQTGWGVQRGIYTGSYSQGNPSLTSDNAGNFYCAYENDDPTVNSYSWLQVARSTDGGATWSVLGSVYSFFGPLTKPSIAYSNGYLFIMHSYTKVSSDSTISQLWRMGTDGSGSIFYFTPLPTISDPFNQKVELTRITSDEEDYPNASYIYVGYVFNDFGTKTLYVMTSPQTNGTSWSNFQALGNPDLSYYAPNFALEYGGSGLYAGYINGSKYVAIRKSTNWGVSFSLETPVYSTDSSNKVGPAIAAIGANNVLVVYQHDYNNTGLDNDILGEYTTNGGASWTHIQLAFTGNHETMPWVSHDKVGNFGIAFNQVGVARGRISIGGPSNFDPPFNLSSSSNVQDGFVALTGTLNPNATSRALAAWKNLDADNNVVGNVYSFVPPPKITSFTPTSGPVGTSVTILGANFNPTPTNNVIYFGGVKATVTGGNSDTLFVPVPAGATFAPISVIDTVNGLSASSAMSYRTTFTSTNVINTGSFTPKVDFGLGSNVEAMVIADFDGDGKPDLAVAKWVGDAIAILRNTSTPGVVDSSSFGVPINLPSIGQHYGIAAGDLDGDGRTDIVAASTSSSQVRVFRNASTSGVISFEPQVSLGTPSAPLYVALGDIDGDGKLDIAVTNSGSNSVSIFRNQSTKGLINGASFAPSVDFGTLTTPTGVAFGDIDADGKADLVVGHQNSSFLSLYRNLSTIGSLNIGSFGPRIDFASGGGTEKVVLGDIDGDGKLDIAISNKGINVVSVFRNTSSPGVIDASSLAATVDFAAEVVPWGLTLGDLDGDGNVDLIVPNSGVGNNGNILSILRNTSSPGFINSSSFLPKVDFLMGTGPRSAQVADFDLDGRPDIASTNSNSSSVSVLHNAIPHASVTFQLDARNAIQWGRFNPQRDSILVRGSIAPLQWVGVDHILSDGNSDSIYTVTINFDTTGSLNFKFVIRHDGFDFWEFDPLGGAGNRLLNINAGAYSLAPLSFSDLPPYAANGTEYSKDGSTVALWHLNDDSSATYFNGANGGQVMFDQSGNANHTYLRGSTPGVGRFGMGRNFDGVDDYIASVDPVVPAGGNFTVEAWVNAPSSGLGTFRHIFSQGANLYLGYDPSGFIRVGDYFFSTGVPFPFDGWHHIAVVRDAVDTYLYIDGVLRAAKGGLIPDPSQSDEFRIGRQYGANGEYWIGSIDEVRVSNVARSQQELQYQIPPTPPADLFGTAGNGQVTLTWNKNTEPDFLLYRIYGAGFNSTTVIAVTTGGITDTTQTIPSLGNGVTYYFRVTAVDSVGNESAYSNQVFATPGAGPRPGLQPNAWVWNGSRFLTWAAGDGFDFEEFHGAAGWETPPHIFGTALNDNRVDTLLLKKVKIVFASTSSNQPGSFSTGNDDTASYAYRFLRAATNSAQQPGFAPWIVNPSPGYAYQDYRISAPLAAYDMDVNPPQRLAVAYLENNAVNGLVDGYYWPGVSTNMPGGTDNTSGSGPREWLFILNSPYTGATADPSIQTDLLNDSTIAVMYWATWNRRDDNPWPSGNSIELTPVRYVSAPTLVSPTDAATNVQIPPVLRWDVAAGATSYRVQVSTNPAFTSIVFDQSNVLVTQVGVNFLLPTTTYYWRVDAWSGSTEGSWSGTYSFTTQQILPPPSSTSNWNYARSFFPTTSNGIQGLAVDPAGKVWVAPFDATDSLWNGSVWRQVRALYVFNPDGTPATFSPVKIISGDTLFTGARGLATDDDGNILYTNTANIYRVNYATGLGMLKTTVVAPGTLTAPAVDAAGNIAVGRVLPGNPIEIYAKGFGLQTTVGNSTGFARSLAISPDGNDLLWAEYSNRKVYQYHSNNGVIGPYSRVDSLLANLAVESMTWDPKDSLLWVSSGSDLNPPMPPYTKQTWYGYNTTTALIVDTIAWNAAGSTSARPRAVAFSTTGDTVYVGSFFSGVASPAVQMFIRTGTAVPHNVTFQAELDSLILRGFNPSTDSIVVNGNFNGWNAPTKMTRVGSTSLYQYTIPYLNSPGSVIQYKFRAFPNIKFVDAGWEANQPTASFNREFTYTEVDTVLAAVRPAITVKQVISQNVTVTFRLDMNQAKERFHNNLITNLQSVWIAGSDLPLRWPSWVFADTANGTLIRLFDDGNPANGDVTAGDNVWSVKLTFLAANFVNKTLQYKYAAVFPSVDTLNGGAFYLDNERGYGDNHFLTLDDVTGSQTQNDLFGYPPPRPNNSGYFTGSGARVRVTDGVPANPNANPAAYKITGTAITVEAWVFPMELPAQGDGDIFVSRPYINGEPFQSYELRIGNYGGTNDPKFEFIISDGNVPGNWGFVRDVNAVPVGAWTHLAGTYDGTSVRLYVNGNLVAQSAYSSPIGLGDTGFYIGGITYGYTKGLIDDVRLWNVTRTQAAIQGSMNTVLIGSEAGLAGYWPLDGTYIDGGGRTITPDLTANHNDLVVQNGARGELFNPFGGAVAIAPDIIIPTQINAVAGTLFETFPSLLGWPRPSVTVISGPAGMSYDSLSNRLSWTPAAGNYGYYSATLRTQNSSGFIDIGASFWVDAFAHEYRIHNNNNARFLFTSAGLLGAGSAPGVVNDTIGFTYQGKKGLFQGQLLVAKSASQVSGGLFNREYGIRDSMSSIVSAYPGFNQAFRARFDDLRAPNPVGMDVTLTTHSKSSAPDDGYVLLDYQVKNTSGATLSNIHVGLGMDWDVGDAANNLGAYDAARRLSYIYESGGATNPYYYGTKLLSGPASGNVIWSAGGGADDLDSSLHARITSFAPDPTVPGDQRAVMGAGPFEIPAGGTVRVVFAVVGGTNLPELQTNSDAAQQLYNSTLSRIVAEVEANNDTTTAQAISYGDTVDASIGIVGDVDYYKFYAVAGDTVEVFADTTSGSGLLGYFEVFDPSGSAYWDGYWHDGYYPTYQNIHFSFRVVTTGIHYIRFAYANTFFNNSFPNSTPRIGDPSLTRINPHSPYQASSRLRIDPMQMAVAGSITVADIGGYQLSIKRFTPSTPEIYVDPYSYPNSVFANSAVPYAQVSPNGLPTTVTFEYGLTISYGNQVTSAYVPGSTGLEYFEVVISDLQPDKLYHYRIVATNSLGADTSKDIVFFTAPASDNWIPQSSGVTDWLQGVALADENNGIVVGPYDQILRTTNGGTTWIAQANPTNYWMNSVQFADVNNGIAVGGAGKIIRTTNAGIDWTVQTSPTGNWLNGVALNGLNGIAVGDYGTILQTTDGGANWNLQTVGTNSLWSVRFADAATAYAVGQSGTILKSTNAGGSWTPLTSNSFDWLTGVWFIGANNGFVVGGPNSILRTTDGGATWTPINNPSGNYLNAVLFYDANKGVIVGYGGSILRTDDGGLTWRVEKSGTFNGLLAVATSGRSTVAVGAYGTILNYLQAVGETETNNTIATANPIAIGNAVVGTIFPTGDVDYFKFAAQSGDTLEVIAGATGNSNLRASATIYNKQGQSIAGSIAQFPTPTSQHFVFTIPTVDTFTVSYRASSTADTGTYQIRLRRFSPSPAEVRTNAAVNIFSNTADLTATTAPNGLNTNVEFDYGPTIGYGITVASPINPYSGIYPLAATTRIENLAANATYHFKARAQNLLGVATGRDTSFTTPPPPDGWVRQFSGTGFALLGVQFQTPEIGTAVGNGGVIVKTTDGGVSWVAQSSGTTLSLRGVSFTDENNGTAVGLGGLILRTTDAGTSWNSQNSNTTSNLRAVEFLNTNLGVVVGLSGTIRKTIDGGTNWQIQTGNTTSGLHGIFIVDVNNYVAVGDAGTVLTTSDGGTTWVPQNTNAPTQTLLGAWFFNTSTGVVTGTGGTILRTTDGGVNWTSIPSNSSEILYAPEFPASNDGIIIGSRGTILRSTDQGFIWTPQSSGTLNDLISVSFAHPDTGTAVGAFGAVLRFNKAATVPAVPLLASPADGLTNQPRTLQLQWNSSPTATSYHFQLSTNSAFTGSFVVDDSTLVDTSRAVTNLAYSTTYYWRARAKNVVGYSTFSSARSFETEALPVPPSPALAAPQNTATNVSFSSLTLRWNSSSTATSYQVQVTTDQTFGVVNFKDSTLADTSMAVFSLSPNTSYYWRVRASNSTGPSSYTSAFTFTTQAATAPSVATNPATGVTLSTAIVNATVNPNGDTATVVFFQWGEGTNFDRTTEFKLPKIKISGPNPVNVSDTLKGLTAGFIYTYRAVARNSNSQTSVGADQTVTPATLPLAPASLQVTTFNTTSATIAWADNSSNEETFRVERKLGNGAWSEIKSLPPNTTTYQDTSLGANSTYYYKVRSANSAGFSAYTDSVKVETVLAPFAQSSVRKVVFPDREIPSADTIMVIVLTNTGSANLLVTIPSATTGTDASSFTVASGFGNFIPLAPGQSRDIGVRFQPSTRGLKQAILQISTNDNLHYPPDGIVTDTLTGNGVDTTPPGLPLNAGPTTVAQLDWYNGANYTIGWTGPADASGVTKLWYKYDSAPTSGSLGNSVTATPLGNGGSAQVPPPTPGVHLTYFYLEDAAGNKDVNNRSTATLKYDNVAPTITHDTATVAAVVILNGSVQGSGAVINASASKASNLSGVNATTFKLQWKKISDASWTDVAFPSLSGNATIPASAFITNNQPNSLQYRVTATDSAGNVATTNGYSVKTSIQTGAPSGLASSASTNWTNSSTITVTWTGPSNAFGIAKLWYKYDTAPSSGQEGSSVTASGTPGNWSAQIPSPSPGQHPTYFYLEDGLGNKTISNYATLTIMFDNVAPTISHNPSTVGTVTILNGSVSANNATITASAIKTSNAPVNSSTFQLQYKRSSDLSWVSVAFPGLTNASQTIPNGLFVTGGKTYAVDYRITATDQAGNSVTTQSYSVTVVIQSNTVSEYVPPPVATLPAGTAIEKAYRIFSVPLDLNDKKPSSFIEPSLGPHASDGVSYYNWRLQRFTAGALQDYDAFKDQSVVTPGAGFWLILREPGKTISVGQGNVVKSDLMRTTGLNLSQNWNILGNPFGFSVPVNKLILASGDSILTRAYYSGTGTTSGWDVNNISADTLRAWQGLALFMKQGGSTKFNVASVASDEEEPVIAPMISRFAEKDANTEGQNWLLRVDASRTDNDMKNLNNLVGMVSGAKSGYDAYDWMVPPMVGQKNVSLYFKNTDGGMMRDVRPVNNEGESWDMKVVTGDKGARIKLDLSGAKAIPNQSFEAYLIDLDESMAYNLRNTSSVEINSKTGLRTFKIVVGTHEYATKNSGGVDLVPREMKLFANYPNPFNPETVIRYQIAGGRDVYNVSLKVYNILGQEVATLMESQQTPGYYEIRFSGRSLTTGVYFYRITVDGGTVDSRYVDVKKMMLLR